MVLFIIILSLISESLSETSYGYTYPMDGQFESYNDYALGIGRPYLSVPVGPKTSEGYFVDPHLLHHVKNIIFEDEISRGPKEYNENDKKIVGIELMGIQQSIEVAQFHQTEADSSVNNYHNNYENNDYSSGHVGYSSKPQLHQTPSSSDLDSDPEFDYNVPFQTTYNEPYANINRTIITNSSPDTSYQSISQYSGVQPSYNTPTSKIDRFTVAPASYYQESNKFLTNELPVSSGHTSYSSNVGTSYNSNKSSPNEMQYFNDNFSKNQPSYDDSYQSSNYDGLDSTTNGRYFNPGIIPSKDPLSYDTQITTSNNRLSPNTDITPSVKPESSNRPVSTSPDRFSSNSDITPSFNKPLSIDRPIPNPLDSFPPNSDVPPLTASQQYGEPTSTSRDTFSSSSDITPSDQFQSYDKPMTNTNITFANVKTNNLASENTSNKKPTESVVITPPTTLADIPSSNEETTTQSSDLPNDTDTDDMDSTPSDDTSSDS